jgi:hypothetical protein
MVTAAAGRCAAIESVEAPAPAVHSPSAAARWHTHRRSSLCKSLQRVEWARSYILHLAALLNERLRLRLCPSAPPGSSVSASTVLSIMQRAQALAALQLQMQFNATDVASVAHLPRLLHPATCLADAQSAPVSPRSHPLALPSTSSTAALATPAAAAAAAVISAHYHPVGICLASFDSSLTTFMSNNRSTNSSPSSSHIPPQNTSLKLFPPIFLTSPRRKQLRQLLTFVPKNTSVTRRTAPQPAPQPHRGPSAAAADIENRRQAVAGTVQQLQLRELRVLQAELCVSAAYMFFTSMLQVGAQTKSNLVACLPTHCG